MSKDIHAGNQDPSNSKLNNVKLDFVSLLDREFRTNISAIVGSANLLSFEAIHPDQRKHLDNIIGCAYRLLSCIEDFSEFAHISDRTFLKKTSLIDLRKLIEDIIFTYTFSIKAKGLEISLDYSHELGSMAYSNFSAIKSILCNLLDNAIRFTDAGQIKVIVEKKIVKNNSDEIMISVMDTGIGLSAAETSNIAQAIETAAHSNFWTTFGHKHKKRSYAEDGIGIGLSTCIDYIKNLGGTLNFNSDPGIGTTFYFTLPFCMQDSLYDKLSSEIKNLSILIISDAAKTNQYHGIFDFKKCEKNIELSDIKLINSKTATSYLNELTTSVDFIIVDQRYCQSDLENLTRDIRHIKNSNMLDTAILLLLLSESSSLIRDEAKNIGYFSSILRPTKADDFFLFLLYAYINSRKVSKTMHNKFSFIKKSNTDAKIKDNGTYNILLVENDQIIQKIHKLMLEQSGYIVDVAKDFEETIRMISKNKYDLVLLDLGLPKVDGIELAKKIRSSSYQTSNAPIIALTSFAMEEDRKNCMLAGMNDYIAKPVTRVQLDEIIRQWLQIA